MLNNSYDLEIHPYRVRLQLAENQYNRNHFGSTFRGLVHTVMDKTHTDIAKRLFPNKLNDDHLAYNATHGTAPSPLLFTPLFTKNLPHDQVEFMLTCLGDTHQHFYEILNALDNSDTVLEPQKSVKVLSYSKVLCPFTQQGAIQWHHIHQHTQHLEKTIIHMHFHTPFILTPMEKNLNSDFSFFQIYKALHWRASILAAVYGNSNREVQELQWDDWAKSKLLVRIDMKNIKTYRKPTYKPAYYKNGYKGVLTYQGNFTSYLPLLYWGQFIHLGQDAAFGFGNYSLHAYDR